MADGAKDEAEEELHACRTGRRVYAWAPAPGRRRGFGGFVCRGCGTRVTCGACAEEEGRRVPPAHVPLLCRRHVGRRVPPAHVPLLCRRHGGLDQLGTPPAIRAISVGMPAAWERRDAQPDQLVLLSNA